MHDSAIHRAMQCPHPGCASWAILATAEQIADESAYLWRCDHGHHGPHLVGVSDVDRIEWSDWPPKD